MTMRRNAFTYNPDSTVATETITGIYNKTLTYTYDTLGRRTSLSLDDGYSVSYTYDSAGRLNTLTSETNTFTYSYIQGSNFVANITYPNNITVNYTYKPMTNLIASVENKHSTTTISKYTYTYNDRDQRIKVTLSDGSYWEYTYDEMGQLTSAIKYDSSGNAIPGHTFDYNFDTIGNRITSRKDAETQSYVSNNLNQYTEIQDSQDTTNPSYDDDGNLLYDGRFTYTWNGENRLIRMETTGSAKPQLGIEFSYDYKGRRIEKKVYENGVLTKHELFIYDGFKCIEKLNALNSNEPIRKYVWQGERLLSVYVCVPSVSVSVYYALSDANKNITEYVDSAGNISAHYEYSPFGKVIASTGTMAGDFTYRFSSEYSDPETALIYYNYRYYSPEIGRWISRDPISEQGGVNLYCFVGNNPVNRWDLWGLFKISKNFNTGKLDIFIIWLKIYGKVVFDVSVSPGVSEKDCPLKFPSNPKLVNAITFYDEENGFGIKTKIGVEGDNFRVIGGTKIGISVEGDSYWEQAWNASIDKGTYEDISAELQFWVDGSGKVKDLPIQSALVRSIISKLGHKKCACVKANGSLDIHINAGLRPSGVAALVSVLAGTLEWGPALAPGIPAAGKTAQEILEWIFGKGAVYQ